MARRTVQVVVSVEDQASQPLRGIAGALSGMGQVAGGVLVAGGIQAAAGGLVGLVRAGSDVVGMAADLEAQLSGIASVTGSTGAEIGQLKQLIQDLGVDPNLKVSSFEAADAIEMLARNGLTTTQILEGAARATVLLANATGAAFPTAADISTDAMALFNIEASRMSEAVDGIASVVNNSKFSIEDYRYALAQGGGVAASVGVDFADFNTTIAAIAPLFASGSDAGTSYKVFLQRLIPQSDGAAGAMRRLGIITEDGANRFFDAEGNLRSMAEIVGILHEATAGLTEEQKNQAFSTIFGTDAMRAAFGIASMTEEEYRALAAQMSKTSAADAAATRMDNLAGSMDILGGIVETLKVRIGEEFIPLVRRGVDGLARWLSDNSDQIVGFFGGLADEAERLVDVFKNEGLSGLMEELLPPALVDTLNAIHLRFAAFTNLLRLGHEPAEALKLVLLTMMPAGFVSLLEPMIDGFFRLGEKLGEAITAFQAGGLRGALESLLPTGLVDGLFRLAEGLGKFVGGIVSFIEKNPEQVKNWLFGIGAGLATFVVLTTVVPALIGLAGVLGTIGAALGAVWAIFSTGGLTGLVLAGAVAWASFSTSVGGLAGILGSVVALLGGPVTLTIAGVAVAVGLLTIAWRENWGGIQEKTAEAWFTISPWLDSLRNTLTVTLPQALFVIKHFWVSIWDHIVGAFRRARDEIQHGFKLILQLASRASVALGFGAVQGVNTHGLKTGGGFVAKNALGTPFFGGGLSLVGERGAEIVELGWGSRIHSAHQSRRMVEAFSGATASPVGGDIHLHLESPLVGTIEVRSADEGRQMAGELMQQLQSLMQKGLHQASAQGGRYPLGLAGGAT